MQFGFVESRGTAMAAALTHDVLDHCLNNGRREVKSSVGPGLSAGKDVIVER